MLHRNLQMRVAWTVAGVVLTVDIRCHGVMGIVFTLHEQQELLSWRDVCNYSIKYLQETMKGWGWGERQRSDY